VFYKTVAAYEVLWLGFYLMAMNHAVLVPMYKKGDKLDATSYQQISNLSTFFKTAPKIMFKKESFLFKPILCRILL
jgi:hypothetical protein